VQLQVYELTKVEKLQIVNLLPTHAVELYVVCFPFLFIPCFHVIGKSPQVIEEFEERFSMDDMEAMLEIIRNHVKDSPTISGPDDVSQVRSGPGTGPEPIVGDGHGGQDGWEAPDELDELMDGPRYGEYEDDLGEDANDDD
jgi:DNA-directed RNA polymerase III subunit RPC9